MDSLQHSLQQVLGDTLSPVTLLIVLALVSLAGAYLGGYLPERGRSRATREDFEEIKRRLKETSEVSHRVAALVSRGLWVEQQRWEFRKTVYLSLLESLVAARATLQEVWELELEDPPRHSLPEAEKDARLRELLKTSRGLREAVSREVDLHGRLFLSSRALEAIERYIRAEELRIQTLQRGLPDSDPGKAWRIHSWEEYLESEVGAAWKAYDEIMAAAKEDLLLDRDLAGGACHTLAPDG